MLMRCQATTKTITITTMTTGWSTMTTGWSVSVKRNKDLKGLGLNGIDIIERMSWKWVTAMLQVPGINIPWDGKMKYQLQLSSSRNQLVCQSSNHRSNSSSRRRRRRRRRRISRSNRSNHYPRLYLQLKILKPH